MKKGFLAAILMAMLAFIPLALLQSGCSSSPAAPGNPTPTPTSVFIWSYPEVYRNITDGPTTTLWAILQVEVSGAPSTSVAVTLSSAAGSVSLGYSALVTHGGNVFANYQALNNFTYTPGQPYTLTSTASGQTATSSATAPGNISTLVDANGAITQASWTVEGNADYVSVSEINPVNTQTYTTYGVGLDSVSPAAIPVTAYTETSTYVYTTTAHVENKYSSMASVSIAYGGFQIWDEYDHSVTFP